MRGKRGAARLTGRACSLTGCCWGLRVLHSAECFAGASTRSARLLHEKGFAGLERSHVYFCPTCLAPKTG